MKTWIYLCISSLLILTMDTSQAQSRQPNAGASGEKFYRWVDEEGNVHYTETLPPDFKDKKADVLDDQGLTRETDLSLVPPPPKPKPSDAESKGELPRDRSGMERPEPLYNTTEMQQQKDALLVLRYGSESEIQDALEVEIRQFAYDTNLLTTSRDSLETAYTGSIRELADRQRAGVEIPPEEITNIETLKRKMTANNKNMEEIRQREQAIREKFAADLERYRSLVEPNNSEEP